MKALKWIAVGLGGLVALVVLALVAVVLLVDPNDYRDEVAARVEAATGRQLTLEGDMELALFPWIALDVSGVALGNPPGFDAPPLLRAERARVGVKLLPLLQRRIEIRRIAIDAPQVELVTLADGRNNWSDLAESREPARDGGGPRLESLQIAGLDVTRGALTLRDLAKSSVTRVRDLAVTTGAIGGGTPTRVELSALLDAGENTAATRLAFEAETRVDTAASRLELANWTLEGERRPAPTTATGTAAAQGTAVAAGAAGATSAADAKPTPFSASGTRLALDWAAGRLEPTTLQVRYGELGVGLEIAGERLFEDRLLTGRLTLAEQNPRALATAFGVEVPRTRADWAFTKLAGSGAFRVTPTRAALEELDVTLDRSRLKGRVAVEDLETLRLSFDLAVDALDVDAYRAPAPATADAAPAASPPAPPSPLPVEALRALNAEGRFAIGRATLAALPLSDLKLALAARDGDVRLQPAARAFGGSYVGDLRLDAKRTALGVTMTHEVRGFDLGAAITAYAKSDRLSGRANLTAKLAGSGTTDRALIDALTGPIDIEIVGGALEGLDVTYELQRAQALFRRQALPARSGPPRTPFRTLVANSRLERGVLASDPIRVETDVLQMRGSGTFRLADQAVDYRLTTVVREVPAAGAQASLADLRAIEIPVSITGTVRDYKVRPDLSAAAKARVKQEVEKRRDEVKQKVEDKVRERLDRLFNRP